MCSKTRPRIETSSPACAPIAASLRSTPAFGAEDLELLHLEFVLEVRLHHPALDVATLDLPDAIGSTRDGERRAPGAQDHDGLACGHLPGDLVERADPAARSSPSIPSPRSAETTRASTPSGSAAPAASSTRSAFVPTTSAGSRGEIFVVGGELRAQDGEVGARVLDAQVHHQHQRPAADHVAQEPMPEPLAEARPLDSPGTSATTNRSPSPPATPRFGVSVVKG